jgi:hypothetical protein
MVRKQGGVMGSIPAPDPVCRNYEIHSIPPSDLHLTLNLALHPTLSPTLHLALHPDLETELNFWKFEFKNYR